MPLRDSHCGDRRTLARLLQLEVAARAAASAGGVCHCFQKYCISKKQEVTRDKFFSCAVRQVSRIAQGESCTAELCHPLVSYRYDNDITHQVILSISIHPSTAGLAVYIWPDFSCTVKNANPVDNVEGAPLMRTRASISPRPGLWHGTRACHADITRRVRVIMSCVMRHALLSMRARMQSAHDST